MSASIEGLARTHLFFMELLIDEIGYLFFAEEITACLLLHQPRSFQLKVGALNLAFVNGEPLRERGGRRQLFA